MWRIITVMIVSGTVLAGLGCVTPPETGTPTPKAGAADGITVVKDIAERRAQFVVRNLGADVSHLSEGDRTALTHIVAAARIIDDVFILQAFNGNPDLAVQVAAYDGPNREAVRDYYRIMYGPWDRLSADLDPFINDQPHPPGAGYYPEDLSKEEFEAWITDHPEDEEGLRSQFSVVRREGDRLVAVPYSEAYGEQLGRAAEQLRAAAAAAENASLQRFLNLRADALLSDDYFESDIAWMDLDSAIEVVIGPYETYEDGLCGNKAAFEAFICVAQPADSQRLAIYKDQLGFMEQNLPIPDEHKNLERGSESPIRVVDVLLTTGDNRSGVQTLAFNLPNDERVREAKGSKKVMLKNIIEAKYAAILTPIANEVLVAGGAEQIDFDTYFNHILLHELSHGIGPGKITVDGQETEVRIQLSDLYSAFEEAKADVLGVYNLYALAARGVVSPDLLEHLPWTYTAGLFRTVRFSTSSAHGQGVVIQTNFLLAEGAIEVTDDGRFRPLPERFEEAFRALAHELLMVQALGSYEKAQEMMERYGTVPAAMEQALGRLSKIPVDIDPQYALEGL